MSSRTAGGTSGDSVGRRRRRPTRSSWMSRLSRSEAPTTTSTTTTSTLPSPSKFGHELALPYSTSGSAEVGGDIPLPVDRGASRDAVEKAETAAATSSTDARRCDDRLGSATTGSSCAMYVSTSAHASLAVTTETNVESVSSSDRRTAAEPGDGASQPETVSARDVTRVTSPGREAIADSGDCGEAERKCALIVKSASELSSLRRRRPPEAAVFQRGRFATSATSLDSSGGGKMAARLRRMVVSLHPGHSAAGTLHPGYTAETERCCLLQRSDPRARRRYDVDNDVIKLLPVEPADETVRWTCDQRQAAPRVATTEDAVAMRRSRSDSAVATNQPTCDAIKSRDETRPTNGVDETGPATDDVTGRPLAAAGDVIVVENDVATGNVVDGKGEMGEVEGGQMSKSPSGGADRFKGLVRKHGAAFHVAGMLKTTRDERQQKAFNSVKTLPLVLSLVCVCARTDGRKGGRCCCFPGRHFSCFIAHNHDPSLEPQSKKSLLGKASPR